MNVRPANLNTIMILRTLKTRWCDDVRYGGMPHHARLDKIRVCDQYGGLEEAPGGYCARSGMVLR
jgi:hypothetical protein